MLYFCIVKFMQFEQIFSPYYEMLPYSRKKLASYIWQKKHLYGEISLWQTKTVVNVMTIENQC